MAQKASTVTLAGDVTYDSIPSEEGVLLYSKLKKKPVRGVKVDILKAGTTTVLATTSTNSKGRYSVAVPKSTSVAVRVWARMVRTSGSGRWDVSVRDNTRKDARYSMQTGTFSTGSSSTLERDVHAPSGWNGTAYSKTRVAAPFAVLDTVYSAMAKVLSVAPGTAFPKLSLFWSTKNNSSSATDSIPLGDIGTTYFSPSVVGIYVLGKADVDTDEYDQTVIAHEWGHYYQSSFSRDDSLGGSHGGEFDLLDRSVAFSEGWGNAWSGIALARSGYSDSSGASQSDGFGFSLSTPPTDLPGWFNESSIQYIFWQLNSKVGFKPIHLAMIGNLATSPAITSIHSFAASVGAASPASTSALKKLLASQNISTATNDAFGGAETNDGGLPSALPLYQRVQAGTSINDVCASYEAGTYNKIGNVVYARIRSLSAGTHTFTVTGPSGSDPDIAVHQGKLNKPGIAGGTKETLRVTKMASGEAVLAIRDYKESRANVCFTIEVD